MEQGPGVAVTKPIGLGTLHTYTPCRPMRRGHGRQALLGASCALCPLAKLQVPGADSDEESKTPSASPRHGRSRPSSSVQESSSESEDGDSRGEVHGQAMGRAGWARGCEGVREGRVKEG